MRNFYALLVGIDNYPIPAHRLQGCLNDANGLEQYLRERFVPEKDSGIKVLRDDQAKRQDVINTFQTHLGQAGAGDTALFYYAGHGSQESAPPEFWAIEPDHKNETLVCYDSRLPGGWDLADKELAKLIDKVAAGGAHVVVILDCCHSGSGTREFFVDAAERRIPEHPEKRPLSSYLTEAQQVATRSVAPTASGWETVTRAPHVLLAACRDEQTAKEYSPQGVRHGALTFFLLDTLATAKGALTYQELFQRVASLVSASVSAQNPQLEATVPADLTRNFLSGEPKPRGDYFTAKSTAGGWVIDGGQVHGIPAPAGGESVALALYALDAGAATLRNLSQAITTARITSVSATSSAIEVADASKLDKGTVYKAVVTALPLPPMPVLLEGDAAGVAMVRDALVSSLYVKAAASGARFRVLARDGQFLITRPDSDRPLVAPLAQSAANAAAVVDSLDHIARWSTLADLKNPLTQLPADKIKLTLIKDKATGEELAGPDVRLDYQLEGKEYKNPAFWIRVRNDSDSPVWCAVLALSELFGISAGLLPDGTRKLNPGEELWALDGKPVFASVPPSLQKMGVTQSRDVIKLLASTGLFDARLLEQPDQEGPHVATRAVPAVNVSSTLNRLMSRVQTRALGGAPDKPSENVDDFLTQTVGVTTVRPRDSAAISDRGAAALGNGVTVEPHSELTAQVRLTSIPLSQRDLGNSVMPAIFRGDAEADAPAPLTFSNARGTDPGLSVLELTPPPGGKINYEAVTAAKPLRVRIETPLAADEEILPFAFDGEFYVPLGRANAQDGGTLVELYRLPSPVADQTRSLGGSIKILFQKLVAKPLGFPYEYPILAAADLDANGQVQYERDPAKVKARVAAAQRIVLCVHGIIGDTEGIAWTVLAGKPTALVLTFDYENINTTIEQNAALLGQRLADAGLGPGHSKTLQIVAHSMGGLVSRWFIEQLGGNKVVQSLVMLGTPSGGSPWPTVEGFAGATAALALNGLTGVFWPAKFLGILLRAARNVDRSLGEMRSDSQLLSNLAKAADPAVPYTIVAGDTKLIQAPLPAPGESWHQRLARSISISTVLHRVLSVAFFEQPNDIAVSVGSATNVAAARNPAPVIHKVASDHLTYFSAPASVSLLWKILGFKAGSAPAS